MVKFIKLPQPTTDDPDCAVYISLDSIVRFSFDEMNFRLQIDQVDGTSLTVPDGINAFYTLEKLTIPEWKAPE